jgi:hypothetical protein
VRELYHLWVQNQDGAEYCDNLVLDSPAAQEICRRLGDDPRVADYVLERETATRHLTIDEAMGDLEVFLS